MTGGTLRARSSLGFIKTVTGTPREAGHGGCGPEMVAAAPDTVCCLVVFSGPLGAGHPTDRQSRVKKASVKKLHLWSNCRNASDVRGCLLTVWLSACAWLPGLADIQAAKARAAELVECPPDLPTVVWREHGPVCSGHYAGFAVGCWEGDTVEAIVSDQETTRHVLSHEMVHWCLWRMTGDGDSGHTLGVWSKL